MHRRTKRANIVPRHLASLALALLLLAPAGCKKDASSADAQIAAAPALDASVPPHFVTHPAPSKPGVSVATPPEWEPEPTTAGGRNMVLNLASPGVLGGSVNVVTYRSAGAQLRAVAANTSRDLPRQVSKYKLHAQDYVKLNGLPVWRIVYSGEIEGIERQWMQATLLKGDQTYVVTCATAPMHFEAMRPTFDQVVASLKVP